MQAVQTVGAMRYQRRYTRKHTIVISVFKKFIIPFVLIFTVMFAVFIPTGADTTENVVMAVTASRSTAQSAAHTLYETAAARKDPNDGYTDNSTKEDWIVTGSGDEMLDRALSAYNYIAYHMDPALDYIYGDLTFA